MGIEVFVGELKDIPDTCPECGGKAFSTQPPFKVCGNPICQHVIHLPRMMAGKKPRRWHVIEVLAKAHGWRVGAELGTQRGLTSLHLLERLPELHMTAVDFWAPQPDNSGPETYEDWPHYKYESSFRSALKRYPNRYRIIKAKTGDAARQVADHSLDFVFIDADHSESAVRRDILDWMPKVKENGFLIGHDIEWEGVQRAVGALCPGYYTDRDEVWYWPKNPCLNPPLKRAASKSA